MDSFIKSMLREHNFWAKKSLGQNFLVDKESLEKIIESAQISAKDNIVEVGPGVGTLTEELAKRAKLVLAIEKDYKLVEFLRKRFESFKNIKIIHEDILTYNLQLMTYSYKVVANLPYNITSPVVRKFLEAKNKPQEMILMVQKEVAERLCAKPGNSQRGILTVMIELYGSAKIIDYVSKTSFYPVPNVDSAIIKITIEHNNNLTVEPVAFMRLVKIGFSQKRRQIHHPLKDGLKLSKAEIFDILKKADIDPAERAEDLKLEDWLELTKLIQNV